jgi:hypothetical protein
MTFGTSKPREDAVATGAKDVNLVERKNKTTRAAKIVTAPRPAT